MNHDVLKRMRSEHDEVLGPDPKEARNVLSAQPYKLKDLRYTAAVIKESLRIHALGQTHREGSPNFSFSVDGTFYPTDDSIIQTVPTVTQNSPDIWPKASEFLPERFLVADGHALYPPRNAWRVFELGSTRCIGEELAMIEMQLVLALTMRHLEYKFGHLDESDSR
jgi:cytochrome P450